MRIIGGRDYYDSALSYGLDKSVVYVRNKYTLIEADALMKSKPLSSYTFSYPLEWDSKVGRGYKYTFIDDKLHRGWDMRYVTIYFTGKKYVGVLVTEYDTTWASKVSVVTYWHTEQFDAFLDKHGLKRQKQEGWWKPAFYKNEFQAVEPSKKEVEFLIDNGITSVIIVGGEKSTEYYIDSDRLGDYMFYSKIDAWTAFQEINMWVTGVLPASARPMIQIADKDKVHKHGFDKWSFRKKVR